MPLSMMQFNLKVSSLLTRWDSAVWQLFFCQRADHLFSLSVRLYCSHILIKHTKQPSIGRWLWKKNTKAKNTWVFRQPTLMVWDQSILRQIRITNFTFKATTKSCSDLCDLKLLARSFKRLKDF